MATNQQPTRRAMGCLRARLIVAAAVLALACLAESAHAAPRANATLDLHAFTSHLDSLIPALLERTHVPGTAVALVEDGDVRWVKGYGWADIAAKRPVTADTIFNVGSISKTITAWAVMSLVEAGKVDLDAPVTTYLKRWKPPASSFDANQVTVGRLLSHTAGLSLGAVPDYGAGEEVPSLPDALTDKRHDLRIVEEPGTTWHYSGGGYMLLQMMIEDVTGSSFSEYVARSVLRPLGMQDSGFDIEQLSAQRLATPYNEEGQPIAHFRYAGLAAAGLYSTAKDLARFLAEGLALSGKKGSEKGVLQAASIKRMQSPAGPTQSRYIKYGFGYSLIPLPGGGSTAGHSGSNKGWMAVITTIPTQGDGFVLLTNSSKGVDVYRWALCDWVEWKCGHNWAQFCDGREDQPGGTLHAK